MSRPINLYRKWLVLEHKHWGVYQWDPDHYAYILHHHGDFASRTAVGADTEGICLECRARCPQHLVALRDFMNL